MGIFFTVKDEKLHTGFAKKWKEYFGYDIRDNNDLEYFLNKVALKHRAKVVNLINGNSETVEFLYCFSEDKQYNYSIRTDLDDYGIVHAEVIKKISKNPFEKHLVFIKELANRYSAKIFIFDAAERKLLFASDEFVKMLGYKNSEELAGKDMFTLVPPVARNNYVESAKKLKIKGHSYFNTYVVDIEGNNIAVDMNAAYFKLGNEEYFISILGEKLEENFTEELRENRAFLYEIINKSSAHVFVKNTEGKYILVNDEWKEFHNKTELEVIGKSDYEVFHNKLSLKFQEQDNIIMQERRTIHVDDIFEVNGKKRYLYTSKFPITDTNDNVVGICGMTTDVTKLKEAEMIIKEKEEKLRLSLSAMGAFYWTFDFETMELKYDSNKLLEFLGYEESEIPKIFFDFKNIVNQDDVPIVKTQFNKLLDTPKEVIDIEFRFKNKSGGYNWVSNFGKVSEMTKEGCPKKATGITILIDARKEMEHDLKEAKIEAESATKQKSEFLANMSHEIRTPMNAIIGFNNLLHQTELNRKQDDYVTKINSAAKNLLRIINDILDFSKVEAGKIHFENIDFSLEEVLNNISNIVGIKAFEKGLEFVIAKSTDVPEYLKGDPIRLGQVLLNIVNNAVKFTQEGEVVVSVFLKRKTIKKSYIHFEIKDTGIGMTEEQLNNLFKAFTQADSSTTRKYGGTGLGLSISKKLIEQMNGSVNVVSEPGTGSTFNIYLELENSNESMFSRENLVKNIYNKNILIVDDSESARAVISNYIEHIGIEPDIVSSGEEALEFIKKNNYDLLILDYKMPGISGLQTWKEIKKLNIDKLPEVIMVTAYGYEKVFEEGNESGIYHVIPKPVGQSMLYNTIIGIFDPSTKGSCDDFQVEINLDKISGASILVVEDNEINQQVIREILENKGFWVEVVENGEECLEMLSNKSYDLILLDLQMPVMDGYTMAGIIRKDKKYKDLPLIALSADAMHGVEKKVREAGIDDYLTKPIETGKLFSALVKWIEPGSRKKYVVKDRYYDTDQEDVFAGLVSFDTKKALRRLQNNKETYIKILKKFAESNKDFVSKLKKNLDEREFSEMKMELHAMKGVLGNIECNNVKKEIEEIEELIKTNKLSDIQNRLIKLSVSYTKAIDEIERIVIAEKIDNYGEIVEDIDLKKAREELTKLFLMIEKNDTSANEQLDKIMKIFSKTEYAETIKSIKNELEDYEYERAEELCKELLANI